MLSKQHQEASIRGLSEAALSVWQSGVDSYEGVRHILNALDPKGWLELAVIDVAATLELPVVKWSFHFPNEAELHADTQYLRGNLKVNIASRSAQGIPQFNAISYGPCNPLALVTHGADPFPTIERVPATLLEMISQSVYHGDALLLLPGSLRQQRLTEMASRLNVSPDYMRCLHLWTHALLKAY